MVVVEEVGLAPAMHRLVVRVAGAGMQHLLAVLELLIRVMPVGLAQIMVHKGLAVVEAAVQALLVLTALVKQAATAATVLPHQSQAQVLHAVGGVVVVLVVAQQVRLVLVEQAVEVQDQRAMLLQQMERFQQAVVAVVEATEHQQVQAAAASSSSNTPQPMLQPSPLA